MAAIPYPDVLPKPHVDSYQLQTMTGFMQSSTAAKLRNQRVTFDTPSVIDVEFRMGGGRKRLFFQWLHDKLDSCKRPFTLPLTVDGGVVVQTCRFTEGGTPQLSSVHAGVYTYRAQIEVRSIQYE